MTPETWTAIAFFAGIIAVAALFIWIDLRTDRMRDEEWRKRWDRDL